MKQKANVYRRDLSFAVGDMVLVRLRPYRQTSVSNHRQHKLSKRFYGPFPVIERIGSVAYKLQLPPESRIHPVFHVSVLKPFRATECPPPQDLPLESFHNQPVDEPEAILDRRTLLRNGASHTQLLVQWRNTPVEEASWEDLSTFTTCYPDFHLEDKVMFEGGGNDTTQMDIGPTQMDIGPILTEPNKEMEGPSEIPATAPAKRKINPPMWMKDYACYQGTHRRMD